MKVNRESLADTIVCIGLTVGFTLGALLYFGVLVP